MSWVQIEDNSIVVDTEDVGWKLRYAPQSMTEKDYQVAAAIASFYSWMTDPMIETDDAVAALNRARTGTKQVLDEIQQGLRDAVVHEWLLDVTTPDGAYLLGPYSRSEAEKRAVNVRGGKPGTHVVLRRAMP